MNQVPCAACRAQVEPLARKQRQLVLIRDNLLLSFFLAFADMVHVLIDKLPYRIRHRTHPVGPKPYAPGTADTHELVGDLLGVDAGPKGNRD